MEDVFFLILTILLIVVAWFWVIPFFLGMLTNPWADENKWGFFYRVPRQPTALIVNGPKGIVDVVTGPGFHVVRPGQAIYQGDADAPEWTILPDKPGVVYKDFYLPHKLTRLLGDVSLILWPWNCEIAPYRNVCGPGGQRDDVPVDQYPESKFAIPIGMIEIPDIPVVITLGTNETRTVKVAAQLRIPNPVIQYTKCTSPQDARRALLARIAGAVREYGTQQNSWRQFLNQEDTDGGKLSSFCPRINHGDAPDDEPENGTLATLGFEVTNLIITEIVQGATDELAEKARQQAIVSGIESEAATNAAVPLERAIEAAIRAASSGGATISPEDRARIASTVAAGHYTVGAGKAGVVATGGGVVVNPKP